jgi:hypothetical protein
MQACQTQRALIRFHHYSSQAEPLSGIAPAFALCVNELT